MAFTGTNLTKILVSKASSPANHPGKARPPLRNGSLLAGPVVHVLLLDVPGMAVTDCHAKLSLLDCDLSLATYNGIFFV
jgi:hypothetical protein